MLRERRENTIRDHNNQIVDYSQVLNNVVHGNPALDHINSWTVDKNQYFNKSMDLGVIDEFISNNTPPKNSSDEVVDELIFLSKKTNNITDEERILCKKLDSDHYEFFVDYCKGLDLKVTKDELRFEKNKYRGIILYIKYHINRPRPFQLAWYHKIDLFPNVKSKTASSPSFPSGHVFDFLISINYLKQKFPDYNKKFDSLYQSIRNVRELSGLHYPSDTIASEKLFTLLKNKNIL